MFYFVKYERARVKDTLFSKKKKDVFFCSNVLRTRVRV